jgi:hypothetical protein
LKSHTPVLEICHESYWLHALRQVLLAPLTPQSYWKVATTVSFNRIGMRQLWLLCGADHSVGRRNKRGRRRRRRRVRFAKPSFIESKQALLSKQFTANLYSENTAPFQNHPLFFFSLKSCQA